MSETARITFPTRVAIKGPEFNDALMPRPYAFKEDDQTQLFVFCGPLFCKWLAQKFDADGKFVLLGESIQRDRNGHFVVDADGFPLVECGTRRVAEMVRDLLNKYRPELGR